jgi:hypothetical protein
MANCSPTPIEAIPPTGDALSPYDRAHFVTYLKLLDAHAMSIDWKETADPSCHSTPTQISRVRNARTIPI